MNKQQVIDWYMDKFADKTLSLGCILKVLVPNDNYSGVHQENWILTDFFKNWRDQSDEYRFKWIVDEYHFDPGDIVEIVWHPLTFWQYFQQASKHKQFKYYDPVPYWRENFARKLLDKWLLSKTIYERVEDEEVLKNLLDSKDLYEWSLYEKKE